MYSVNAHVAVLRYVQAHVLIVLHGNGPKGRVANIVRLLLR